MDMTEGVERSKARLDQWLWFARFVKSRSLAARLCAAGAVTVNGSPVKKANHPVRMGDVVVLPAGTGHQRLEKSHDLLVVGAYPETGKYDELRASKEEHDRALKNVPKVPLPKNDPVYGKNGPLLRLWS